MANKKAMKKLTSRGGPVKRMIESIDKLVLRIAMWLYVFEN